MGHQQIAVPVQPMGHHIPLVLAKMDVLRHIGENKAGAVILTGAEVVKFVVVELRQPRAPLRVGK